MTRWIWDFDVFPCFLVASEELLPRNKLLGPLIARSKSKIFCGTPCRVTSYLAPCFWVANVEIVLDLSSVLVVCSACLLAYLNFYYWVTGWVLWAPGCLLDFRLLLSGLRLGLLSAILSLTPDRLHSYPARLQLIIIILILILLSSILSLPSSIL